MKKWRDLFSSIFPLLIASLLLLTACGFQPVHGDNGNDESALGLEHIQVVVENDRLSQLLKAEMEDQFNPDYIAAEKTHTLTVTITESIGGVFINPDGTSSRNNVNYNTSYVLTRAGEKAPLDSGNITRVSSYNISERADYATYVAEQDARRRGVLEIARAYKLRLAGLFARFQGAP